MIKCATLVLLVLTLELTKSDITIDGVQCGQIKCQWGEYCSDVDGRCIPCTQICDPMKIKSFEKNLCMRQCQDYLHDERYLLRKDFGNGNENLKGTVQKLQFMISVTLTLVCLMLIALLSVFALQLYRWKQKKNITMATIKNKLFRKKGDTNTNKNQTNQDQTNGRPDLRLEMPSQTNQSDHSPVTVTTSISRRPAEDSTLDYAYDNPGLVTSPSPTKSSNNGTFH